MRVLGEDLTRNYVSGGTKACAIRRRNVTEIKSTVYGKRCCEPSMKVQNRSGGKIGGTTYLDHVFIDESQDQRYFLLGAVTVPSIDTANSVVGQARKALGSTAKEISEFHESALNLSNPEAIDTLINSMVFEYYHRGTRHILRHDIGVWTAYYRKTRAERQTQSLPFARLLVAYVNLFEALMSEIQPERGTLILCDGFQGIARILPQLQRVANAYGATVSKGASSVTGIQLADVATGTTRRLLSQQNTVRYGKIKDIVRLHKEVFLSAK